MVKWTYTKPKYNYIARLKSCRFVGEGNLNLSNMICAFGDLPFALSMLLIGMDLLSQFDVTIDYPRQKITMTPYPDGHIEDNYFTAGLNFNIAEGDSVFI